MAERSVRPGRSVAGRAFVWKRFDFRESSRIVAVLLREHGVVHALCKGAHRPDSPLLGRLDFLNEVQVQLTGDRDGLRVLRRADLLRERRGLRAGRRFLAATYLAELCDTALPQGRADPEVFDLVDGGLALLERCPLPAIPAVVLGLELRLLQQLGALADLECCAVCGSPLETAAFAGEVAGALACDRHAAAPRRAIPVAALQFLRQLRDLPGRQWPLLGAATRGTWTLPSAWLTRALDHHSRLRRHVFGDRSTPSYGPTVDTDA